VFTQPWPATQAQKASGRCGKTMYYQHKADRARRTLRGIDEQVAFRSPTDISYKLCRSVRPSIRTC
jgi:hypothetical protein